MDRASGSPSTRPRHHVEPAIERALRARERRLAGAREPFVMPPLAEIRERLERMLGASFPAGFSVHDFAPLTGGASKQHFVFEVEEAGGARRRLVLRTALAECLGTPPDFEREAQVQRAVRGTAPVAEVVALDADGSRFGAPAIVLGLVPGVTAPPEAAGRPSGLGMLFPPERRGPLGAQFVEALARIHAVARSAGADALRAFERPAPGTTQASDWLVAWWRRVWDDDRLDDHPMVEAALDWLAEQAPVTEEISLVHGDYRSGNFLFDPAENRITAILDWELARFGDRHEDLGWTLATINGAADADGTWLVGGLVPREAFLARYAELSGLPVDPERLFFYEVVSELKVAVIALGIGPRNAHARQSHAHLANLVFAPLGSRALRRLHEMLGPLAG